MMITRIKQFLNDIKIRRWEKHREIRLQQLARESYATQTSQKNYNDREDRFQIHALFVCEEFFHPDLRGFGGFGKTVKNIAEYFNKTPENGVKISLALSEPTNMVRTNCVRRYHDTDVFLRPSTSNSTDANIFHEYAKLLGSANPRVFITIDWYPSYAMPIYALSALPLLIWIHDPRDKAEWTQIATVADELRFRGASTAAELIALAEEKSLSIKKLFALQHLLPRKIVFATTAQTLVERAQRTYNIASIPAYWLPNPIEIPVLEKIEFSERPSLLYLGRLDAVKRPWIAFELANRHPDIDFLIAGQAHVTELMDPWIKRYKHLSNLKLLGHVDGIGKDKLLRTCWGIINTSVHEAEPVSFLEAFSYGKCVLSCHDPDSEVTKFGYYTGEILGDGLDNGSLERFSTQIQLLISDSAQRHEKGFLARKEMEKNHTFKSFHQHLQVILEAEGI